MGQSADQLHRHSSAALILPAGQHTNLHLWPGAHARDKRARHAQRQRARVRGVERGKALLRKLLQKPAAAEWGVIWVCSGPNSSVLGELRRAISKGRSLVEAGELVAGNAAVRSYQKQAHACKSAVTHAPLASGPDAGGRTRPSALRAPVDARELLAQQQQQLDARQLEEALRQLLGRASLLGRQLAALSGSPGVEGETQGMKQTCWQPLVACFDSRLTAGALDCRWHMQTCVPAHSALHPQAPAQALDVSLVGRGARRLQLLVETVARSLKRRRSRLALEPQAGTRCPGAAPAAAPASASAAVPTESHGAAPPPHAAPPPQLARPAPSPSLTPWGK